MSWRSSPSLSPGGDNNVTVKPFLPVDIYRVQIEKMNFVFSFSLENVQILWQIWKKIKEF